MDLEKYMVKGKKKVELEKWDPDDNGVFKGDKKDGEKAVQKLVERLDQLQELLYAGHQHKVLIVLQAMDTGGKDGTVRHVFRGVNPQGVKVFSFKTPSVEEMDHDYLWRVHNHVPAKGEITVFNRSHYEDVLIARVHELVPQDVWEKRFEHIKGFEQMLADEGTTILKFYLNISRDEQKNRIEQRLLKKDKNWKFSKDDLKERKYWDQYMKAYEEAIEKTSSHDAPWYIVPANKKWYRNLIVTSVIVDALEKLNMKYPVSERE